jgi:uncharacterized protein (UPF0332 family)
MTPQAAHAFEKAKIALERAESMLETGLYEDAKNTAYQATSCVIETFVVEFERKTSKPHRGVRTKFVRLRKNESQAQHVLTEFLSVAFDPDADPPTDPEAVTPANEAREAIATARQLVTQFIELAPLGPLYDPMPYDPIP